MDGVLALVLAGGEGGRLEQLTAERAKPAVPFAGVYRLIDFVLSNCMHSGIRDVWVIQQYEPHALSEHLANGRPWDLDRTHGGFRVLQPYLGRSESGWYKGNTDAIYRHKAEIEASSAEVLLVLSADHVYRLDYRDVVLRHRETGVEATVVTTEVDGDAGRFGVVQVDGDGRLREFAYKPDEPEGNLVTAEVFAYDVPKLLETLERLAGDGDDAELGDFGEDLLPALVERGGAYEHRLEGYWKDVGTLDSYWSAHMELLGDEPLDLDEPGWAIFTPSPQRPPARIDGSARIDAGLLSPGCVVRGEVVRSVLSPGVVVEAGATIRDSIVLHETKIGAGASVERAILDEQVAVGERAQIGASGDGDLVVVGRRAEVRPGAVLAPGARVDPAPA